VIIARRCLLALLLFAPVSALAQASLPPCVTVEGVARWGADAYNHFVRVTNGCDRPARCQVATDVSPERHAVEVAPGQSVEVITFRGSPASAFTPRVTCELAR
jgi:hypothetical protein